MNDEGPEDERGLHLTALDKKKKEKRKAQRCLLGCVPSQYFCGFLSTSLSRDPFFFLTSAFSPPVPVRRADALFPLPPFLKPRPSGVADGVRERNGTNTRTQHDGLRALGRVTFVTKSIVAWVTDDVIEAVLPPPPQSPFGVSKTDHVRE